MDLGEFVRIAEREFAAVPAEYRRGIAGPVVRPERKGHPRIPGYWTLGECVPVPGTSGEGDEHLSTVFLWYGSFVACARRDESFDMETEIRETVRHEILHHLEDGAGAPDLRNEDEAEEQNERRLQGLPFHPAFYRLGEPGGEGLWRVPPDLFLEIGLRGRDLAVARREGLAVRWKGGETLRVEPADLASLPAFVPFEGDEGDEGDLVIVVREG